MTNRFVLVLLGVLLVLLGSSGMAFFRYETARQNEEYRAGIEVEKVRADEERSRAEDLMRQLEEERQRFSRLEAGLAAEQERGRRVSEQLEKLRRQSENRRASTAGGSEKEPGRDGKTGQNEPKKQIAAESKAGAQQERKRTRIRFNLYPDEDREVRIAHVHPGDTVKVRVRRMGRAGARLYAGLSPNGKPSRNPGVPSVDGSYYPSSLLTMPIRDEDRFTVSAVEAPFPGTVGASGRKTGVILNIGIALPPMPPLPYSPLHDRGWYKVEVDIDADNEWGIQARSLI